MKSRFALRILFYLFLLNASLGEILAQKTENKLRSQAFWKESIVYQDDCLDDFVSITGYVITGDDKYKINEASQLIENSLINIFDENNHLIASKRTDDKGRFEFKIPKSSISTSNFILSTEVLCYSTCFIAKANKSSDWKIIVHNEYKIDAVSVEDKSPPIEGCSFRHFDFKTFGIKVIDRKNSGINEAMRSWSGVVWMGR